MSAVRPSLSCIPASVSIRPGIPGDRHARAAYMSAVLPALSVIQFSLGNSALMAFFCDEVTAYISAVRPTSSCLLTILSSAISDRVTESNAV